MPQPDSPTRPSVSPSRMSNDTPSTACTAPTCLLEARRPRVSGKCLTTSRTSTSGRSRGRLERLRSSSPATAPPRALRRGLEQAGHLVARARRARGSSGGSTWRWRSRTYGQRGWNEQPPGRLIRLGGRPGIGTSSAPRGRSRRGIERSSPHVYGCSGAAKIFCAGARSTIRPAYMTATSSTVSAITPRSWVIITTAVSSSSCSRRISARICACTVTSSAVVGSSAISRRGSLASAIAIIARWRMPPENSCG